MAGSDPKLVVAVTASLDAFQAGLIEAARMAEQSVNQIEQTFANANPRFGGNNFLAGIAQGIGQQAFGTAFTAASKLLDMLIANADALAKLGQQARLTATDVETFQRAMSLGTAGGRGGADAAQDLVKLGTLLNDARRDENDLTRLLDANNVKWKDQAGNVISLNQALMTAANLIRNAGTELDKVKIAQAFGLTPEWIKTLEKGPNAVKDAMDKANVASGELTKSAEKFQAAWSSALKTLGEGASEWLKPILDMLTDAVRKANELAAAGKQSLDLGGMIDRVRQGTATREDIDALEKARRDINLDNATRTIMAGIGFKAQVRQRLIDLEKPPSEERQQQLEAERETNRLKAMQTLGQATTKIPTKDVAETVTAFDTASNAIGRHIAAMKADAAAVGLTAGAHEQLRVETRLLEAARQDDKQITDDQIANYAQLRRTMDATQALQAAGIQLTADQTREFARLSRVMKETADNLTATKTRFEGINDAMRFAGNQLIDVIDRATQKGANFGQIMSDVLRQLARQMLAAAIVGEGAFAKLFGTATTTGGVGGILGVLTRGLGTASGGSATVADATFGGFSAAGSNAAIIRAADGGTIPAGGLAYVGEHGPNPRLIRAGTEPVMVTPNDVMGGAGRGLVITGGDTQINVAGSADRATIDAMQAMLAQRDRRFIADVASATRELRRRSAFA